MDSMRDNRINRNLTHRSLSGLRAHGSSCDPVNRPSRYACWPHAPQVQFSSEARMPGDHPQIVCTQCEKTEEYCDCEKYCTICKGQHNVRLCSDGLYYCPDCREACDVSLANEH